MNSTIEIISKTKHGNRYVSDKVLDRLIEEGKVERHRDIVPNAFNLGFKVVDKYFFK